MNYLDLVEKITNIKLMDTLGGSWTAFDQTDGLNLNIMNAINLSLQDHWLNYNYIFKNRTTTMTCVAGQFAYDMPFNGKLLQNGLLLQPMVSYNNSIPSQVIMNYSYELEKFYQTITQAEPKEYTTSGEQLLLYPVPDQAYVMTCLYESLNWALSVTTIDTVSNSGQNVLSVASTQEFDVGDIVYINKGNSTEETGVISSIQSGASLTFIGNLTFTHQVGERVTVERQALVFQNDEPNLPEEYHNIILYAALIRLFYNDTRQQIYINAYQTAVNNMISNSKNTQSGGQAIRLTQCRW